MVDGRSEGDHRTHADGADGAGRAGKEVHVGWGGG